MTYKLVSSMHSGLFHRCFINAVNTQAFYCSKKDNKLKEGEEVTKESLEWRSSWDQTPGTWYSKFKIFSSDHNNMDLVRFLQSPIDFRPSTIKKWYNRKKRETERKLQDYLPERNAILGNDLAAAHFIVYRGGAVKFHNEPDWIQYDENIEKKLPNQFVHHKKIQAIDCSQVNLFYEGLANFRGLENIEWFSVNGCKEMDDWCMDRISGMFKNSLVYLDLRNCDRITDRGIGALYRNTKLKTLVVDDYTRNKTFELTCLLLQELNPKLEIKTFE